jgi:protein TonB
VSFTPFIERLRTQAGRRTLGMLLALLIEALVLLLLVLSLATWKPPGKKESDLTVVTLAANEPAEKSPEPKTPEHKQQAKQQPVPKPPEKQPPVPQPPLEPIVPPVLPMPYTLPQAPAPPPPPAPPAATSKQVYGPPDTRAASSSGDSERVGTMPNGEPLYAAAWYREPRDDELGPYLSTAQGPGWGLIACRTAPDYRVEDCIALDEYPHGSQINRAILAAAWEFKVLPPRLGGKWLVGSWVRIRIDYGIRRR